MPIVVSDASPLRALAHLKRLDLLASLFSEVLVPPAVVVELRNPESALPPLDISRVSGVRIQTPANRQKVEELLQLLDAGESEALALALETGVRRVLIDEANGRRVAKGLRLRPLGVLGVLTHAKRKRLVTAVLPLADSLRDEIGFFMSSEIRAVVARRARE